MHEWALAEGVISTALEVAEREGLNEITAIKIKMGELQQIDLEIFELALREIRQSQMSMVTNATAELEKEAAVLKCRVCEREWAFGDAPLADEERESIHFLPEIAHTYITCPECKSPDFQFVKGRGVWIDSIVGR